MQREYLHEDLHLIRQYFPGARSVALRTPFDLTDHPKQGRVSLDTLSHDQSVTWSGDVAWIQ